MLEETSMHVERDNLCRKRKKIHNARYFELVYDGCMRVNLVELQRYLAHAYIDFSGGFCAECAITIVEGGIAEVSGPCIHRFLRRFLCRVCNHNCRRATSKPPKGVAESLHCIRQYRSLRDLWVDLKCDNIG